MIVASTYVFHKIPRDDATEGSRHAVNGTGDRQEMLTGGDEGRRGETRGDEGQPPNQATLPQTAACDWTTQQKLPAPTHALGFLMHA